MSERSVLSAEHLRVAYEQRDVIADLSVAIPPGRITAIIGANACGKSTLLRTLARLLKPRAGTVLLDGGDIAKLSTKEVARRLSILPQTPVAPEGLTVVELVARGRFPHQRAFRSRSAGDDAAIAEAMTETGILDLAERQLDELSGGQRQRAWIAMALAQETEILLLDEPTTFLDVTHQVEVLDLLTDLNRRDGRTIVLVLHDLNQACRYADHLIAMRGGEIVAQGAPGGLVTEQLVEQVFDLPCHVMPDPICGTPMIVPLGRHVPARPPAPVPAAEGP